MTPLERAVELIAAFDAISDYPVQCALKTAKETYEALNDAGIYSIHWKKVIIILEHDA